MSPYLWNKSGCHILQENHRAIYLTDSAQLRMLFLPITLDCLPVQSFHNSIENFRVHANITFLINGDKRPLLKGRFLKHLEMSPFRWKRFCRAQSINSAMLSLVHEIFLQMAPWFWRSIWLEALWMPCSLQENFRETSALCLLQMCKAIPTANLHISVFHVCATCPK